ncbi:MAG TPA: alpha/beta hydrolase-fold protein [Pyrinomonadaceae bacterium]|nr:alpha/beta hydrolase-fold protein [Pyrinomonadaceae bacterium]
MTRKIEGESVTNREGKFARRAFARVAVLIVMLAISHNYGREAFAQTPHTLTGEFRTHAKFHSKFLKTDRDVLVYLPPDYDNATNRRYPVLYLHDGQNLFDGATSFIPGMEWRIDETAQSLITSNAIEPLIVVGIYNTGKERVEEYTPTKDARHKVGGRADAYGRMIVEELKPFVDAHYRTRRDAANTGLGGSSLGGLVSLYLGLRYPKVFGKLAVVSPSVWWDNRMILRDVSALGSKPDTRIWLDTGTDEAPAAVPDTRSLRDALVAKGWSVDKDLKYFEDAGAKHSEQAWAKRVEPILRFLFPAK